MIQVFERTTIVTECFKARQEAWCSAAGCSVVLCRLIIVFEHSCSDLCLTHIHSQTHAHTLLLSFST